MPASSYLPAKNAALAQRLSNFVTVANANMPALKLTPYDLVNIQTAAQQFHADMTSAEAAKQAAISAVHSKKTSRANGGDPARILVKRIAAVPNVPSSLIQQLGMTLPAPRRKVVPLTVPQMLQATVQPTTQILLT